ncbi:MAG: hypothetical protein HQK56_20070 [Deltaproteobacteria bacterium]|nr:hypothetical protein [Deltaproteobacteria bacterium]
MNLGALQGFGFTPSNIPRLDLTNNSNTQQTNLDQSLFAQTKAVSGKVAMNSKDGTTTQIAAGGIHLEAEQAVSSTSGSSGQANTAESYRRMSLDFSFLSYQTGQAPIGDLMASGEATDLQKAFNDLTTGKTKSFDKYDQAVGNFFNDLQNDLHLSSDEFKTAQDIFKNTVREYFAPGTQAQSTDATPQNQNQVLGGLLMNQGNLQLSARQYEAAFTSYNQGRDSLQAGGQDTGQIDALLAAMAKKLDVQPDQLAALGDQLVARMLHPELIGSQAANGQNQAGSAQGGDQSGQARDAAKSGAADEADQAGSQEETDAANGMDILRQMLQIPWPALPPMTTPDQSQTNQTQIYQVQNQAQANPVS